MTVTIAGAADHALRILFFFGFALLFAAVEIEIEGAQGWAERLPTWYRLRPWYARLFARLMGGKPLTGYHATMIPLALWSFHLGFATGAPWSLRAEAAVLAAYLVWVVIWDFLWFLLNPAFTWARFRQGAVWWHDRRWIGRFPIDYYRGFATSVVIAGAAAALARDAGVLLDHLILIAGMCILTAIAAAAAPLYHRWYLHMRRPGADERDLVLPRR